MFGVFDELHANQLPLVLPLVYAVVSLELVDDVEAEVNINVRNSKRDILAETAFVGLHASGKGIASQTIPFDIQNMSLPAFGRYTVNVNSQGIVLGKTDFRVDPPRNVAINRN